MRSLLVSFLAATLVTGEVATTLRLRSTSAGAGALFISELVAIDSTGKLVTLGQIPILSGGTITSGSADVVTDLAADAYNGAALRYTFAAGATATINISFPSADISRIVVVVRASAGSTWHVNAIQTYAAGGTIDLINDATSTVTYSTLLGAPTDTAITQVIIPPGAQPIVVAPAAYPSNQSPQALADGIRQIFITPGINYVYIRDLWAVSAEGYLVSFGRGTATGSAVCAPAAVCASAPTDLLIDTQGTGPFATASSAVGNIWSNFASGTGNGLRLDLGASFPSTLRFLVWYHSCVGCGDSAVTRSNGARFRLFNGNNVQAADFTGFSLASFGPHTWMFGVSAYVTPSVTPTASRTASASNTASNTGTSSVTPSPSNTPSGSLPAGAEPSRTSSVTASPTNTATNTPSQTQTPTSTPVFARGVRVRVTAGQLAITEVLAFDVNGVLLSAAPGASPSSAMSALSAVVSHPSGNQTLLGADAGNDLAIDTYYNARWAQSAPANASAGVSPFYEITFARPARVARVHVFIKKGTTSFAAQWGTSGALVELMAPHGVMASRLVAGTGFVQTAVFAEYTAPVPVPAANVEAGTPRFDAETGEPLTTAFPMARYVLVHCSSSLLSVRELMVLDYDNVNIALRKPARANGAITAAAGLGVDGTFDNDVDPEVSTFISVGCPSQANLSTWEVDLGGAFFVSKVLFAQRLNSDGIVANTYLRNNGVPIRLLNAFRNEVWRGSVTNGGGSVQTFDVSMAPPSPSMSVTPSMSPSLSASPSNTATGSLTVGALPSATTSSTASVTSSITPSSSATATLTPSGTRAPLLTTPVYAVRIVGNSSRFPLSVVELQVFSSSGKLLSGTGICAPSCQDGFPASAANDNDVDPVSSTYALTSVGPDATPASFTFTLDAPAIVSRVVFVQRKGAFAGNVYSIPAATNFAPNAQRLNARVELIMEAGGVLDSRPANRYANLQTLLFAPPLAVPVYPVAAQSPADERRFVRFIRMHCWFSLLAIRELQVFTEDGTNVALGKTAWSNYYTAASLARYAPSNAVDGIMEGDDINSANETAMFLSNACPQPLGSGASVVFWQLDLGASYDVKRIIFFNRMPATGSTGDFQRNVGAPFVFLNGFNDTLLGASINGVTPTGDVNQFIPGAAFNLPSANFVQTFNVDLSSIAVPSASATPTNTPSVSSTLTPNYVPPSETPTVSGTATVTPSNTATGTATTSFGSSSSQTGTTSATASVTATPSGTPPPTPSASATPGVASGLRVAISGGVCLSFFEVIAVSPTGQILTVGATASATSVLNNDLVSFGPQNAIDLQMTDPTASGATLTQAGTNSRPFSSGCGLSDSVTITFAPALAGSVVDKVYFVNDASSPTVASRVVAGNAQVQLLNGAGVPYASQPLTSATLTTLSFYSGPAQVPVPPPVSDSESVLASLVRYVRVVGPNPATGGVALRLREVWAIDGSGVIVSAGKPVTTSPFAAASFPENLTNGVIDFDAGSAGDLASSGTTDRFIPRFGPGYGCASDTNCNNTNWLQIDLGGMFNVTQLLIWNRAGLTFQTQIAGGSTFLINAYGQVVGAATGRALTTAPIQSLTYSLYAPTSTPTTTGTPTPTRSNTPSSSTTASTTGTPTSTRSSTGTSTQTRTGSGTPPETRSSSATSTGTRTGTPSTSGSRTGTPSSSGTRSSTPTSSGSSTGSMSATASETASVSATQTGTPSASQTQTGTPSASGTQTGTPSASGTQTGTPSASQTGTASQTPSLSSTGTAAATGTGTPASTGTGTPAVSGTATKTRVPLPSSSPTRTRTRTASRTKTRTRTRTRTPSKKKKLMA